MKARSVVRSSRLRLDVDPDLSAGNYRVILQTRLKGVWADLRRVRTQGHPEVRVVNLPKGRYRVVVPAQRGMQSARSRPVRLAR